MRPHRRNEAGELAPDMTARLYVTRDDTTSGGGLWWCVWATPGSSIYVGAEGYCSRRMDRTRGAASAYGERRWGERPIYWPASMTTAPEPRATA
jgi:hypothetical protein